MDIVAALRLYGIWGAASRAPEKFTTIIKRTLAKGLKRRIVNTAYGVPMRANWGDLTFEMCFEGSYGSFLAQFLRDQTQPFVFLDIGANQGLYSIIAADNPNCKRAYAFEPVSKTFGLLRENIKINGLDRRITALQFGVSDANGIADISIKPGHSGAASIHHQLDGGADEQIELRTSKAFAAAIEPTDLPLIVKVDVEGHELIVLEQLISSSLGPRITSVFYEVDECWVDPTTLTDVLDGFSFFTVGSGTHYDILATRKTPHPE